MDVNGVFLAVCLGLTLAVSESTDMPNCVLDIEDIHENITYCTFSNWLKWDCDSCENNYEGHLQTTLRKRALCCSKDQTSVASCLAECNKPTGSDEEVGICVGVCPTLPPTTTPTTTYSTTTTTTLAVTSVSTPQSTSATTLTTTTRPLTTTEKSEATTTSTPVTSTTATTITTTIPTTISSTTITIPQTTAIATNVPSTARPLITARTSEETETFNPFTTTTTTTTSQTATYSRTIVPTTVSTTLPSPTTTERTPTTKSGSVASSAIATTNMDNSTPTSLPSSNEMTIANLTVTAGSELSETCSLGSITVKRGPYEKFTYCTLLVTSLTIFGMIATVLVVATVVIKLKRRNAVNDISAWD